MKKTQNELLGTIDWDWTIMLNVHYHAKRGLPPIGFLSTRLANIGFALFLFPFPLLSPTIVVRRPFWGANCFIDHLGRLGSQRSSGGIVKMESA